MPVGSNGETREFFGGTAESDRARREVKIVYDPVDPRVSSTDDGDNFFKTTPKAWVIDTVKADVGILLLPCLFAYAAAWIVFRCGVGSKMDEKKAARAAARRAASTPPTSAAP